MSREHVLPNWMGQHGDGAGDILDQHTQEGHARPVTLYPAGSPFERTTKRVCRDCNTGWMSALEGAAKPLLERMIFDKRSTPLSLEDQALLARWGVKTLMTMQLLNLSNVTVTPGQRRELMDMPLGTLTDSTVMLGRMTGSNAVLMTHAPLYAPQQVWTPGPPSRDPAGRECVGALTTILINEFVIQTFVSTPGLVGERHVQELVSAYRANPDWCVLVHPPTLGESWPPRRSWHRSDWDAVQVGPLGRYAPHLEHPRPW
jgi:hypothetical protein